MDEKNEFVLMIIILVLSHSCLKLNDNNQYIHGLDGSNMKIFILPMLICAYHILPASFVRQEVKNVLIFYTYL